MDAVVGGFGRVKVDQDGNPSPPVWLDVPLTWAGPVPGLPPFVHPAWFDAKASISPTALRRIGEAVAKRHLREPTFLSWWPTKARLGRADVPWILARAALSPVDPLLVSRLAQVAVGMPKGVDESGLFKNLYGRHREKGGIVVKREHLEFLSVAFARIYELGEHASSIVLAGVVSGTDAPCAEIEDFVQWTVARYPRTVEIADRMIAAGRTGLKQDDSLLVEMPPPPPPQVVDPDLAWRVADLEDRLRRSEEEKAALREEMDDLVSRHDDMRRLLAVVRAGHDPAADVPGEPTPTTHAELFDWIDGALGPSVHVLPRAFRSLRKAPDVDVARLVAGLRFLRDVYVPYRSGTAHDTQSYKKALTEVGFDESPSFTTASSIEAFPEYKATWRGETIDLDRHLKRGIGNATRTMIRVYFHWDKASGTVVVGHMPGHLANWRKS